jgi:hypothetical protein
MEEPDHWDRRLLPARSERPRSRSAAKRVAKNFRRSRAPRLVTFWIGWVFGGLAKLVVPLAANAIFAPRSESFLI